MVVIIEFTAQAIADMEEIASYIGNDSVFYASLQIQKIIGRLSILETFPLAGRIVPELNVRSIRELLEGNYRIIYRIVNKELVHVLTIHHSRRVLKRTNIKKLSKGG